MCTHLSTDQEKMYDSFIRKIGIEGQLLKSVEETSELSVEIIKFINNKNPEKSLVLKSKIIEELGDAFNALDSLMYILNINKEDLDKVRLEKLLKQN